MLDTTDLEAGEYEYLCTLHAWMTATLVIEEPKQPIKVTIPEGAGVPDDDQIYYDPQIIDVTVGTTVVWENDDSTVHTVTSGEPPVDADGVFDSEMMVAGDKYEFTFTTAGSQGKRLLYPKNGRLSLNTFFFCNLVSFN